MTPLSVPPPPVPAPPPSPDEDEATPASVLRAHLPKLAAVGVAGAVAGVIALQLRAPVWEAHVSLNLGAVASDPLGRPGDQIRLVAGEEAVELIESPSVLAEVVAPGSSVSVDATLATTLLRIAVTGDSETEVLRVADALATRIEADNRGRLDAWHRDTTKLKEAYDAELEALRARVQAGGDPATLVDARTRLAEIQRQGAMLDLSRSPVYLRTVARIAAPSALQIPKPNMKAAAAGAVGSVLLAWTALFLLALRKQAPRR